MRKTVKKSHPIFENKTMTKKIICYEIDWLMRCQKHANNYALATISLRVNWTTQFIRSVLFYFFFGYSPSIWFGRPTSQSQPIRTISKGEKRKRTQELFGRHFNFYTFFNFSLAHTQLTLCATKTDSNRREKKKKTRSPVSNPRRTLYTVLATECMWKMTF